MTLSEQTGYAIAQDNLFAFLEDPAVSVAVDRAREVGQGPLQGLLVGVKSNIAVAGQAWTAGIRGRSGQIATQDADAISVLDKAGAAFLSRLTMDEAALGAATEASGMRATRNPAAPEYSVGGSSGGAAAAVASGAVSVALGSDTLGSVRIPAAYCGVLGLKPSRDLLPMGGVFPLANGFDTLGLLADSTEVIHRILDLFGVSEERPNPKVVEAVPDTEVACAPEVRAAVGQAKSTFEAQGIWEGAREIEGWKAVELRLAAYSLVCTKALKTLAEEPVTGKVVTQALRYGARLSDADIAGARTVCERAAEGLLNALSDNTVLMTPTTPEPAFLRGATPPASQADFTAIANVAGVPALAVPILSGPRPVSVQLIGAPGTERSLLDLADKILRETPPRQTPA